LFQIIFSAKNTCECLFLIYVNDITQAPSFTPTIFADDINLHMSASILKLYKVKLKMNFKILTTWSGQKNCLLPYLFDC